MVLTRTLISCLQVFLFDAEQPKDRGGIGRTGHKRKLAAARRAAAAAGLPKAGATLPPLGGAAAGASTDAEQVDFLRLGES